MSDLINEDVCKNIKNVIIRFPGLTTISLYKRYVKFYDCINPIEFEYQLMKLKQLEPDLFVLPNEKGLDCYYMSTDITVNISVVQNDSNCRFKISPEVMRYKPGKDSYSKRFFNGKQRSFCMLSNKANCKKNCPIKKALRDEMLRKNNYK